jgi:hypothetical protein
MKSLACESVRMVLQRIHDSIGFFITRLFLTDYFPLLVYSPALSIIPEEKSNQIPFIRLIDFNVGG